MRRVLVPALLIALFVGVGVVLSPWLRNVWRLGQLVRERAPGAASLASPLPGRCFADTWGAARSEGRRHEGVDIFAPRGTPIRSATQGVVVRVGRDRLGGRVITVMGPGGYNHYYAHLERYAELRGGAWVERGDVVGFVGNSGNARTTPPHLHYGVYTPGWQAVNPFPLIQARAGRSGACAPARLATAE